MMSISAPGVRALLVGTGRHTGAAPLSDVEAVETTIRDVALALTAQCGVRPENIQVLVDPDSPMDVGLALADAAEQAEDVVLFYYVGHGLVSPDGELHLATATTNRSARRLGPTSIAYATVRNCLTDTAARCVVVILDCCFAGRAIEVLADNDVDVVDRARISGGFVLTASARDEMALARADERHTAFSGELLRLLSNGDPTGPPELTLHSVFRYLLRTLPAKGIPRPQCRTTGGVETLVLARNVGYQPVEPHTNDLDLLRADALAELDRRPDRLPDGAIPYPGLRPFREEDAALFFGRRKEIAEVVVKLAERLSAGGPLLMVGSSGSGKTSILASGVVPLLRAGLLPHHPAGSPILMMRPGADPLRELATHLAELTGEDRDYVAARLRVDPGAARTLLTRSGARAIIVVDQLEEVFTICRSEDRDPFLWSLLSCAELRGDDPHPAALVMLCLRSHYLDELIAYRSLVPAVQAGPVVLQPLGAADVGEIIRRPAAAVGARLESGLVELLLRDAGIDPTSRATTRESYLAAGHLPLLSFTLAMIWSNRRGDLLTVEAYYKGGVRGIGDAAERAFQSLNEQQQLAAQDLFLRMIVVEANGGGLASRPVAIAEISPEDLPVLDILADARLIEVGRNRAEMAHEGLIRWWSRLSRWVEESRESLVAMSEVESSAREWEAVGREASYLYTGARLDSLSRLAARRPSQIPPIVRKFLNESSLADSRRSRQRLIVICLLAFSVALNAALAAALLARLW
jgi:hypothetical protein